MLKALHQIALLGSLFVAAGANATVLKFDAPLGLTGAQEVPPRATPASGTGLAFYDDVALTLEVFLDWEDLLAPAAAAHIHCCSGPGVNSSVAIDFVPAGFPAVVTGSFDHAFDLTAATSFGGGFLASFGGDVDAARDAVVAGLTGKLAYFNIHTSVFPGGEIRGDIAPVVPEPATLALVGLGLALGFCRRRFA